MQGNTCKGRGPNKKPFGGLGGGGGGAEGGGWLFLLDIKLNH